MSESQGHEYLTRHQLSGDVLALDIEAESRAILEAAGAAPAGHAAKTLVKDGPLRLVILGFKAGSSLKQHRTDGPLNIQALTGSVSVETPAGAETLSPGKMLVLGPAIEHSVGATAESVLLLTIAWPGQ